MRCMPCCNALHSRALCLFRDWLHYCILCDDSMFFLDTSGSAEEHEFWGSETSVSRMSRYGSAMDSGLAYYSHQSLKEIESRV